MFSVNATIIAISQSPAGQVSEGTEVTLTCVTDESIPNATIAWFLSGEALEASSDSVQPGRYSAMISESELVLITDRTMNNKEVQCSVVGQPDITDQTTLEIQCKQHKS